MNRRKRYKCPSIDEALWQPQGQLWIAKAEVLKSALWESPHSHDELIRRLGSAVVEFEAVKKGEAVSKWTAWFIEWAISPDLPARPLHQGPIT